MAMYMTPNKTPPVGRDSTRLTNTRRDETRRDEVANKDAEDNLTRLT
jgi:hypothetical protein